MGWPNHGHAKFIGQNMGKNFWIALGWVLKYNSQNFGRQLILMSKYLCHLPLSMIHAII
jgi:hypothetical protein